jgi:aspartate/methionine/tyrosine aminotransferase
MKILHNNAMACVEGLRGVKGLRVVVPQGAMYLMVSYL